MNRINPQHKAYAILLNDMGAGNQPAPRTDADNSSPTSQVRSVINEYISAVK